MYNYIMKIMKKISLFFFRLTILVFLTMPIMSCEKTPIVTFPDGYENYANKTLTFSFNAATAEIVFEVNTDWSAELSSSSWCSISPTSGNEGLNRIKVRVAENNNRGYRGCTIKLMHEGDIIEDINIRQQDRANEAVDLGLSVKWAPWNVGASSPEEYGGYYAWGETEEKEDYSSDTYLNYSQVGVSAGGNYSGIGDYICGYSKYDAAYEEWGDDWRIPKRSELSELVNKCSWERTSVNGVIGYKVIGPNGNSIFLPASGYYDGKQVKNRGMKGYYWSGEGRNYYGITTAYYLYFSDNTKEMDTQYLRYGLTIRPVYRW